MCSSLKSSSGLTLTRLQRRLSGVCQDNTTVMLANETPKTCWCANYPWKPSLCRPKTKVDSECNQTRQMKEESHFGIVQDALLPCGMNPELVLWGFSSCTWYNNECKITNAGKCCHDISKHTGRKYFGFVTLEKKQSLVCTNLGTCIWCHCISCGKIITFKIIML